MKLIRKFIQGAVVSLSLAWAAIATAAVDNQDVLVRLGPTETITAHDLSVYLDRRVDLRPARRNLWGVQSILREMALIRTLALEGDALKVPRVVEDTKEKFDDIYSHAVYKKLIVACEPPADSAAARKYFDEHPQAFRVPPMARLTRVMLPVSATLDGEGAMAWLLLQAQGIASGTKKLDDVVLQAEAVHRLDPQGDLGWVTLSDDVPILRALTGTKQGELVGPVREGDFGYLFYVSAKREGRALSWDEVAASVPMRALNLCRQEANEKLRDTLFKKYSVEFDQKAIDNLFSDQALGIVQPKTER